MIRRLLVVAASAGLVAVWGSAAFLKSLDPAAFAEQITLHHVTPAAWSPLLATLFILAEALLALAHLVLFRPRWTFAASGLLLLFFIGVTGWSWSQGNVEGCGCFGRLAARHPREVIIEDLGFVAIALAGWIAARGFPPPRASRWLLPVLSPLALALPFAGPHLPGDSLVTSFNPGEDLSHLAADDLPVPLEEGPVLLVLLGGDCPACLEGLERLNDIAGREGAPPVAAVFAGTRAEARTWALDQVPAFGVASAPVKVLRQYYRTLPQVALLQDGTIRHVWRKRIPGWDEVRPLLESP